MNEHLSCKALFSASSELFRAILEEYEYPWEILPHIKRITEEIINRGLDGYRLISDGIIAGRDVYIDERAHIEGPCIIGHGSEVRHGAFIRGSVIIGNRCVIGNSSEIKNSIIMNGAQVPHFNYVGDSILGEKSHLGAGAICSNLRSDGKAVLIRCGEERIDSHLRKLGAILGDKVEVGCGAVLCPGTVIGRNTVVYPLTLARGFYPPDSLVKSDGKVAKKRE